MIYNPDGTPHYVRIYDNGGETFDRYTAVLTGRYRHKTGGSYLDIGMSENPFHPQGHGQHGESNRPIGGAHLGKRIPFSALPEPCQRLVMRDYAELWGRVKS